MKILVGVDVSKGYADILTMNENGQDMWHKKCDDTQDGHLVFAEYLSILHSQEPNATIIFGVEATGGLERNWIQCFKNLPWEGEKKIFRLNPLAVKRFSNRKLHRSITDKESARTIADYLRINLQPNERPYSEESGGLRTFSRLIRKLIKQNAEWRNQIQSMLPASNPDLVKHCRDGLQRWVLLLLQQYPTATHLAQASVTDVAKIPYINVASAAKLIKEAQQSVASVTDEDTGMVISVLATRILSEDKNTSNLKEKLYKHLENDDEFQRLTRITSIGQWTASVLRLEIGHFDRFYSADALLAFCGLDPSVNKSGDSTATMGISKEGNSGIRAVLYTAVLSGLNNNQVVRDFYDRLRNKGKNHFLAMTACMRKMVHICYACLINRQEFDPSRPGRDRAKWEQEKVARKQESMNQCSEVLSLAAPISRREAQRRKAAALSQQGLSPDARDHAAAMKHDSKKSEIKQQTLIPISGKCHHDEQTPTEHDQNVSMTISNEPIQTTNNRENKKKARISTRRKQRQSLQSISSTS